MDGLRRLPAVHRVAAARELAGHPATAVTSAARLALAAARDRLKLEPDWSPGLPEIVAATLAHLSTRPPGPRPVINATGVILHTNLGRAPVSESAALAGYHAARGYTDLELDLATGKRANRTRLVRAAVATLCGAESAAVVNNCAAATVLTLRALAAGREVIVSRGQLVEIGGSYRLPEILAASGARLREVGTTNITRVADYEAAITPATGLILRVHPSNYRVEGFAKSVPLGELVRVGQSKGVPVVDDAGSGRAFSHAALKREPDVRKSIGQGADLALFSGDKLLGGPQAGLIAGRKTLVAEIERDPLARAMRADKVTLAALAAVLAERTRGVASPVRAMLETPVAELAARAERLRGNLRAAGLSAEVVSSVAFTGGGSAPGEGIDSVAVAVSVPGVSEGELASKLRAGEPAVVARVKRGRVLLDLRTVFARDDEALAGAVMACWGTLEPSSSIDRDRVAGVETSSPAQEPERLPRGH